MLQTARSLEDERGYMLTKLFATTGIAVLDIPSVTVETARSEQLPIRSGKKVEIIRFPASLQEDLLRYAAKSGHITGMIFTKKNGTPIERMYIQKLVQVPVEKGNIRAFRQLHKTTISTIEANFDLMVRQAHERQLDTEQLGVGWE